MRAALGAGIRVAVVLALAASLAPAADADPGMATGSISYRSQAGPIIVRPKYAYLVKGPDTVTGNTVRRVVLSVTDLAPRLRTCATMMCGDGDMSEGLTIDLDAGPRINYWFVANGQRVQYSGTAEPSSLRLSSNTQQRVAGAWRLDARPAGGPQVQIEFDAALLKVFTQPH
ncbi:MAG TPA: hypothetical protein VHZ01_05340 [Casimicrobiaceae bacterium]|nr:hypothetical protein [Casimicrobiaceae bacterium]